MTTVLVTGAGGFLGQHLLRELREAGCNVRGLSRGSASDDAIAAHGAFPVRGDLLDGASLATAVAGVDAVFHAAADTGTWRGDNARQTRINVGGTAALLAAAAAAGVGRVIHTSSVSAYSHRVHEELRETVAQRGGESWINYERDKFATEQLVRGSGLDWVVLQPAHILGPGDRHNWSRLIRLVDTGALPGVPPGSGAFADVREVARAHVQAWRSGIAREAFLLGGEHVSFLQLIGKIGARLGRKVPQRATPAWALVAYTRALDLVSRVTRRAPALTPEAAAFTCHHLRVDSGKAVRALGYRMTPIDTLLDDTLAWMRREGMLAG
ncbi:NAD-dependent epimerase/dehydratase family protein [Chiayiivirga flava]|uniref:Nucleoside-diphosphate-sugar epimerase n=1 Tax=Chiayiivirga flava TaxID=659595 RepID=A0A7W8D2I4_9GAMM|nr:NAD-dependent epimerase/dehydratase family protein [Chiayiivirga flava]MBB5206639.1 nucleoside-diphosphate-sugar epimerase [Chiayiivirga flava]